MPKATQWDSINLDVSSIQITFNESSEANEGKKAAITGKVTVQAKTPEGDTRLEHETFQKFDDLDEDATPNEIYDALGTITGANLQNVLKLVGIKAINEDLSA
ncbi:hypothetical protein LCGC14_2286640 [marine sediment metagenome]|uniref:Uncharacterized protein n=1 Tax=marine sediment metagenome TaxID=412755 RepID=A0A0F9F532_9ZZZZ